MRRTRRFLTLAALALCAGCASWRTPVVPPRGALYTNFCAPLTTEFRDAAVGGKTGSASTLYVREPFITGQGFAWDDASIQKAARAGGLSRVDYADYHILEILGVVGKFTVEAHGE